MAPAGESVRRRPARLGLGQRLDEGRRRQAVGIVGEHLLLGLGAGPASGRVTGVRVVGKRAGVHLGPVVAAGTDVGDATVGVLDVHGVRVGRRAVEVGPQASGEGVHRHLPAVEHGAGGGLGEVLEPAHPQPVGGQRLAGRSTYLPPRSLWEPDKAGGARSRLPHLSAAGLAAQRQRHPQRQARAAGWVGVKPVRSAAWRSR